MKEQDLGICPTSNEPIRISPERDVDKDYTCEPCPTIGLDCWIEQQRSADTQRITEWRDKI